MTEGEFRAFFAPTFDDTPAARITTQLALSVNHFDVTAWDVYLDEGTANWVAHNLVVNGADKAIVDGNDVIHRETETVKIARDPVLLGRQARDPYMRTTYGQRYRYLANIVGVGAVTP